MRNPKALSAIFAGTAGLAMVSLITAAIIMAASLPTKANTEIAQKTGQPCSQCHTTAPELNDYGKKYQENLRK